MASNIYNTLRFIISDNVVGGYSLPDFMLFQFIDNAIEKLSQISDYTFKEDHVVTQAEINQGYITLNRDIQELTRFPLNYMHITWEYGGGNKIRLIDPNVFIPNNTYTFYYRAKYTKFKGIFLDDLSADWPKESELGMILYALGDYTQSRGIYNARTGDFGLVLRKAEDGLSLIYGAPGFRVESFSPDGLREQGIALMRDQIASENMFFSVKV